MKLSARCEGAGKLRARMANSLGHYISLGVFASGESTTYYAGAKKKFFLQGGLRPGRNNTPIWGGVNSLRGLWLLNWAGRVPKPSPGTICGV